jgi:uncharacterized membrane protein
MEIILILLFAFLKFYLILGCIFTLLTAFIAFSTKTENDYTVGEIFAMLLIYPVIIYYLVYPERNDYGR